MSPIHLTTSVSIYPTPTGKYPAFTVCWRFQGRRLRKKFSALEDAKAFATDRAEAIGNGKASADALSWDEICEYRAAKKLNPGISLVTVGEFYKARKPASYNVAQAVSDFMAFKRSLKRRRDYNPEYLRNTESRLQRFSDDFQCDLGDCAAGQLQAWIGGLGGTLRTQNNYLGDLRALFRFAIHQRNLPREYDEHERVILQRGGPGKIQPYTPEQAEKILRHCEKKAKQWLPYFPLRMFSGNRAQETTRLKPANFRGKWISADASITKTEFRRLIPILPNLRQWLKRYRLSDGFPPFSHYSSVVYVVEAAGVDYQHNGFRDSYISYRMAIVQDAAKVGEETGHDVKQLRSSYREIALADGRLITPSLARKYFALKPW